jgi:hypothetical protein
LKVSKEATKEGRTTKLMKRKKGRRKRSNKEGGMKENLLSEESRQIWHNFLRRRKIRSRCDFIKTFGVLLSIIILLPLRCASGQASKHIGPKAIRFVRQSFNSGTEGGVHLIMKCLKEVSRKVWPQIRFDNYSVLGR